MKNIEMIGNVEKVKDDVRSFDESTLRNVNDMNDHSRCLLGAQLYQMVSPLVDTCLANKLSITSVIQEVVWVFARCLSRYGNDLFTDDDISSALKDKIGVERYEQLVHEASCANALWLNLNHYRCSDHFKNCCESFIKNLK